MTDPERCKDCGGTEGRPLDITTHVYTEHRFGVTNVPCTSDFHKPEEQHAK